MERKSPNAGKPSRRRALVLYASALSLALLAAAAWVASSQASGPRTTPHSGAGAPVGVAKSAVEAYGRLPLSFEANEGQADAGFKFISRGGGYALLLTGDGAVLSLGKHDAGAGASGEASRAVVRMKLVGANGRAEVEGLEELPGKSNYFAGNDPSKWRTDVPHYAKVRYADVYGGVDLVYYGNQRQLEYDFVVAPGADLARVRMSFEGAEAVEVDDAGELVLKLAGGELRQRRPVVYQESGGVRREVAGRYVVSGARSVGFEVGEYDPAHTLVIDPVLVYSTYLGGGATESAQAVAVDSSGNAYVTGVTGSTNFPTQNPFQTDPGDSNEDVFVTKLNPAGTALVYSTYIGGNGSDQAKSIAVDSSGSAYVAGQTLSTNFPTASAFQTDPGDSNDDVFVTKLGPAGNTLVYSTYLGGGSEDVALGVAVDSSGSAYVTGYTSSTNYPTQNPFQTDPGDSNEDVFVTKLTPAGNALVYSTYLGGGIAERSSSIAVDPLGSAYVTGQTGSSNFPTQNPIQTDQFSSDVFVTKLTPAGNALIYSTYLGGNNQEVANGIALDSSGSAYVAGQTSSTNYPTQNPFQTDPGDGAADAFVTKLNPEGSGLAFSTYLGGGAPDFALDVAVDSSGSAYVTGQTASTDFPTQSPFQTDPGDSNRDAFVTKLNPSGNALAFSTYLGGNGVDNGIDIAVDSSGVAYVVGDTFSTDFLTQSPFQTDQPGQDGFVAKIATNTFLVNSNDDANDGTCNAAHCSLREAINASNLNTGVDRIEFNIPGPGVHTITPISPLPVISDPAVIDGYTQPGSSPNTLAVGDDAVILIELNGASAGVSNGLTVSSGFTTIRGLVINLFLQNGIHLVGSNSNVVSGNFIGTGPSGTTALRNLGEGVLVENSSNNTVGGATPAQRNVISGNNASLGIHFFGNGSTNNAALGNYIGTNAAGTAAVVNNFGVRISSGATANSVGDATAAGRNVISGNINHGLIIQTSGNSVRGNFIGTDAAGNAALGNGGSGVMILGGGLPNPDNNAVGGMGAGEGNLIAFNGGAGVFVGGGTGNRVLSNSIHSNGSIGIDLTGGSGVTPNDAGDADSGANNVQNFPVLASAVITGGTVTVTGTLNSVPAANYHIEFFRSPSCDPTGNGEGQTFLGAQNVFADSLTGNAPVNASFAGVAAGEAVTATATALASNDTSEFSQCVTAQNATTFTVTNTNDAGAGSLRQAITDANNTPGVQTIAFAFPSLGVHTITPLTQLPDITDPVVIDGYTQPGSSPNTKAVGDDAVLLVELNGASAGASADGLTVVAGSTTIRGLVINRFGFNGIHLNGSSNNLVSGNFIGTNAAGTAALGNDDAGVLVESSGSNVIGGTTPAARNLISGNRPPGVATPGISISGNGSTNNVILGNLIGTNAAGSAAVANGVGVRMTPGATGNTVGGATAAERNVISGNSPFGVEIESSGNFVRGNFIGTNAAGTAPLGNTGVGVLITGSIGPPAPVDNNAVGGTGAGEGNVIAFNGATGVRVSDGAGNRILSNSIHSNGLLGIELAPDGVTPNDAGDADTGANNLQNFPALSSATVVSGSATVTGTLNSTPNSTFRVEFFTDSSCDASGNGEGRTPLSFANVNTDGAGNADISAGPFAGITPGQVITATATNTVTNDTSEFSQCVTAQNAATINVTNTNDTGEGSLRQAISDANATPGVQTIQFNIPGAGVHTVAPVSALPTITDLVVIDGYTQPGSSANTLDDGNDAVPLIELDGTNAGPNVNGLTLSAGNSTVRGLVINRFRGYGVFVNSGGNTIGGCFIGTDASGTAAAPNFVSGVRVSAGSSNTIGGTDPSARNVISGNANDGVELNTGNGGNGANVVRGNFIGTNKGGTAALPNTRNGVTVANSSGNLIGGALAGARNVISGNALQGVTLLNATSNLIRDNFIGVAADGASPLGNGRNGVLLSINSNNNAVGGTTAGAGNLIANNGANGVGVDLNCVGNAVLGNSIRDNVGRGIDLNLDGVTQNDALDTDEGGNAAQNFPVLTSAPVVLGSATVFGTLGSTPDSNFTVQFFANSSCDSSGNGEGQRFLGSAAVTTDASGNANVTAGPFPGVSAGDIITATATDNANNDTSEFSKCLTATTATALTVTNTDDDGEGSLRRALTAIGDGGAIDFAPGLSGTVTLLSELVVNRPVTIIGPGSNLLTLSGGNVRRLLNVQPGGVVNVRKLSFSNGKADDGGAILNGGTLTLTNCNVSISEAARGGAVFNSGTLNVEGSTLNSNSADEGGGIFNSGAANVNASTLNGNDARAGGGIFNGGAGALNVTSSTVSDNRSDARGGGIANEAGQVTVSASTVAGNTSLAQTRSGGGVSNASGTLSLRSSIVATNTSGAGADDINGAVNSLDYNLIGDASGASVSGATAHNVVGKAPLLGPLQNNGGTTDTRALLAGSPALDAGDDALALATDQRGSPRKVDGNSDGSHVADIGAFESGFTLSGRVLDDDALNPLAEVALTLSGNSVTRTSLSTDAPRGDNFTIMDVPAGDGYEIKAKASLQLDEMFSYSFPSVCVDVSAAGVATAKTCETQAALNRLDIVGVKRVKRFADIEGRVTDGAGKGVGGVAITLSGPKTAVFIVPECQGQDSGCGRYEFKDVPTGVDYTMTPKKDLAGFLAHPFDNGRGGADMNNLGADGAVGPDGKVKIGVDFDAGFGPPPPTPSDNFTSPTPDPNRFKNGVVSLSPEAFEPAVRVVQGEGELQITPPDFPATKPQGTAQSAAAQVERFNGYVSVRDIDLNTSTSVSVKAAQPLAEGGAQTVFSVGRDSENFYRIRVGDSSSGLGPVGVSSQVRAGGAAAAADAPAIFFESLAGGSKFQSAAPFDKSVDVFWRLRFEPRTPTPPAVCADASAQTFVLFETSVDRTSWRTRYCAPVGSERTHVAAELLAGVVGDSARDAGTAKFSDYRVAEKTGLGFARPDTFEVEKDAASVEHLTLTRNGDVSSAASVVLKVGGSAGASSPPPCTAEIAPPCKVFFAAGQSVASFSFANPARDAEGAETITLTLQDAVGGALDAGSAALTLNVVDRGFRGNKIGESGFFAAQHYCDFLGRAPDDAGLSFWTNEIEKCGTGTESARCREVKRINVSAAFFLSIEYKETSYFVYKLYELSFSRKPLHLEMLRDAGSVGEGVVVGQGRWQEILEANKRRFVEAWMNRADFRERFDNLKSADFVDTLYANAGVAPSPDVRTNLILELATGRITRAQVLRAAAEDARVSAAHFNRAFVLTQYFGYLRRDPDDVGFNFWLKKLDDFKGDFVAAEMVKAFIDSEEYKGRFKDKPLPSCGP